MSDLVRAVAQTQREQLLERSRKLADDPRRRTRERVRRSDGRLVTITKPPRADILWYPALKWRTVLVRRTHNFNLAEQLAEAKWSECGGEKPLAVHRIAWFRTFESAKGPVKMAAEDELGRVVQCCAETDRAAGPGIEFRP